MHKRIWAVALVAAMLLSGGAAWAEDGVYVVAVRSGGVGTKIVSLPYTITTPGFYYLGRNLAYSGNGHAITIEADNVTLDLMGYTLSHTGPAPGVNPHGIHLYGRKNVEIRNGEISGFYTGISETHLPDGANHRVINIRAVKNQVEDQGYLFGSGIELAGKNHLVRDCTAANNGSAGIALRSGTISGCVARDNRVGIALDGPGSLVANAATNTNSVDTVGFKIGSSPNILVSGNSANGNGINYDGGGAATIWAENAGR